MCALDTDLAGPCMLWNNWEGKVQSSCVTLEKGVAGERKKLRKSDKKCGKEEEVTRKRKKLVEKN